MEKVYTVRIWLFIATIVCIIASGVYSLISIFKHLDLDFEIVSSFVFGVVCFILGVIYPVIYKAELMIEKMDEEDKKN